MSQLFKKELPSFASSDDEFKHKPQLKIIESQEGRQSYIFFSIIPPASDVSNDFGVGMLEVLINEDLEDDSLQLVIDNDVFKRVFETTSGDASYQASNSGPINIGGGEKYLLTMSNTFS